MKEVPTLTDTTIDIDAVQRDTPACRQQVFLDSAGSSLPPTQVLDEVLGHLRREAEVGGYRAAQERIDDAEAGYQLVAEFLDCEPRDVAFTDSATRAWLAAFDAVPLAEGDRVLVTEVEYGANAITLLRRAEQDGISVEVVPSDEHGQLSVEALRDLLDERVKLVSLVHVPTNGGLVNPVTEVAAAAHEVGALVLLDACQSIGQLPVRVRELGVDIVAGTGRKWLRGPRGTGLLVVTEEAGRRLRPRVADMRGGNWDKPAEFSLRHDARVFELWEHGVAERHGLIAAVRYAHDLGIDAIAAAVRDRAERLRHGLSGVDGVEVRDLGENRCGLVTFTVAGRSGDEVKAALRAHNVTVTVSPQSSTRYDMTRRGLDEVVRASPHYFVSPDQLDDAVQAVKDVAHH